MILEKNDSKKSKKQPKDKQAKKVLKILAKQKKQRGKNQRRDAPPLSSQRSLTYKAMYENGVCELKEGL